MTDREEARSIAAIFGRSCKEPGNDPGLDPTLDWATEEIARIRAEERAKVERLREALKELMSIVTIQSEYTDDNFAWAEMIEARKALADTDTKDV